MAQNTSYPALSRIPSILNREIRIGFIRAILRLTLLLIPVHIVVVSLAAFLSTWYPFQPFFLYVILYSYCIYFIIPVWFIKLHYSPRFKKESVARHIDRRNPLAHDMFQTCMSLENHPHHTLKALDELYQQNIGKLHFPRQVIFSKISTGILLASMGLWALTGVISPESRVYFLNTIFPYHALANIPNLHISLSADREITGIGSEVTFTGQLKNYVKGQRLYAHVQDNQGEKRYPLTVASTTATYTTDPVQADFSIYFSGSNGKSKIIKIKALPPPHITSIKALTSPPPYTKLGTDSLQEGVTNFSVLPGSKVKWEINTSRPLQTMIWRGTFPSGNKLNTPVVQTDSLSGNRFFSMYKSLSNHIDKQDSDSLARLPYSYTITLVDKYGIQAEFPILSTINMEADTPPEIRILHPETNSSVSRNEKIDLALSIKDDFQVTYLGLAYKVTSDGILKDSLRKHVTSWLHTARSNIISKVWDIAFMDLRPENIVDFYFIACDNDRINGPKCARSNTCSIRNPSIQEIMAQSRKMEARALSSLKSASARQRQIAEKMNRLKSKKPDAQMPFTNVSGYEIRKIMLDDPQNIHNHARQVLEQLKSGLKTCKSKPTVNKLSPSQKKLEKSLQSSKENTPKTGDLHKSMEEQLDALEKLNSSQHDLKQELSKLNQKQNEEKDFKFKAKDQLKHTLDKLTKNLEEQEDLKEYFQSKLAKEQMDKALKKDMLREQQEMVQDMKEAMDDLENFVQKSMENKMFSPELLEKLEKVQQLLSKVMPDSLVNMMQKKMEGENINPDAIKESLESLLQNQESYEQKLDQAIGMLEQLEDKMKLEEWQKTFEELLKKEQSLRKDIAENSNNKNQSDAAQQQKASEQAKRQSSIQKVTKEALEKIKNHAAARPKMQGLHSELMKKSPLKKMDKVNKSLKNKNASERKKAESHSKAAEKALQSIMQSLASLSSSMQKKSISMNIREIEQMVNESIALAQVQELTKTGTANRQREGWNSPPALVYANLAQVGQWIRASLKKMAAGNPFVSSYLLTQSRLLVTALTDASLNFSPTASDKALTHNHNVTRELLKLLKMAKNMPSGSGQGSDGESGNEGDQKKPSGGEGDLSSQLKGFSGQQLAINSATSQLLKAMLQARKKGGSPMMQQSGGQQGGSQTAQGLANKQGQLSEQLESLAESTGEEGGASEKLRRLAQEARDLEQEMRKGRISGETTNKQERFRSRLLEVSKALKERGYSEKRKGDSGNAQTSFPGSIPRAQLDEWLLLLEKEKKRAGSLDLKAKQKKAIDYYYKTLLTK
ncbi:MAG: hypothetical protein HQK83_01140 [Fibrobacteria bacterium]|nr:hypothetical protein [Fibrobacteria bacterium]